VIRASARSVMEELREVIGVLRDGAEGDAPEPPQPTLADLPALVEESRSAGMEVRDTIAVPGGAEALPATIGRTVYRIAQEGLTNARKHAPGAPVALRVETMPDGWVRVQVRNAAASPSPREPLPGAGSGLVGLAERVALVGGELDHGPLLDGGFRLRATLPVPAP
jgi:signal transduction histidine kinase